jgi:predicted small secreted protein
MVNISPKQLALWGLFLIGLPIFTGVAYVQLFNCSLYTTDPEILGRFLEILDELLEALRIVFLYGIPLGFIFMFLSLGLYLKRKWTLFWAIMTLAICIPVTLFLISIVLASFNTTRSKGPDAAIKANLSSLRVKAEEYFTIHANYGEPTDSCSSPGTFFSDPSVQTVILEAEKGSQFKTECKSDSVSYVVAAPLRSYTRDTGLFCKRDVTIRQRWCIDSAGASRQIQSAIKGFSCPTNVADTTFPNTQR